MLGDTDLNSIMRGIIMTRQKKAEEIKTDSTVELLKQLINQNEQIIQLLTKLKERFI